MPHGRLRLQEVEVSIVIEIPLRSPHVSSCPANEVISERG